MKLTNLAIDGIGVCNNVNFSRFGSGLNLIYGENGSGKSTIRRFVRGVLFGYDEPFWANILNQPGTGTFAGRGGQLGAVSSLGSVTLTRPLQVASVMEAHAQDTHQSVAPSNLVGSLTSDTYDAFYNVDLQNRTEQAFRAATQLRSALGVPFGISRWATQAEYQTWKAQADSRLSKMESLRRELASTESERASRALELQNLKQHYASRVQTLDTEIVNAAAAVQAQLDAIQSLNHSIETLEIQIADLQARINNVTTNVKYVANVPAQPDRLAVLYERLDEIDNQVGRWRRVQTDIQNQRVRLRDEMVVWNDLTLESEEHPYFRAREILVSLESRLDDVENQARHWENAGTHSVDPAQQARNIVSGCSAMREELYGLCQELGSQYKHIRHKAAVAELKQLRRCYNEMGENIKRLLTRRENTIGEIRQVDPAGAEAIMRADHQFCECARHEGFLEARRRHVGSLQIAAPQVDYTVVHPDLTVEREQLSERQSQLQRLVSQRVPMDAELSHRNATHARLVTEREQLQLGNEAELNLKISQLDTILRRLNDEIQSLQIAIDEDRRLAGTGPNETLTVAGRYLQRMSEGDLIQVWLTDDESRIQVSDRRGSTIPVTALGPGDQHLVILSLCLAGATAIKAEVPIMLDDVFSNIDTSRAYATSLLLNELGNHGQQILAFTCHRAVLDHVTHHYDGVLTRLDLPQTTVSPAPVVYPERIPYTPQTPPAESVARVADYVPDFTQPPALNTYPYIKYPVAQTQSSTAPTEVAQPTYREAAPAVTPTASVRQASTSVSAPVATSRPVASSQVHLIQESSPLNQAGITDLGLVQALDSLHIFNIAQLIELDPDNLSADFAQKMISADHIDRLQAECWMMVCVPGMAYTDARVLVASGIQEPEQLDTTPYDQLVSRVSRYLNSSDGQRFASHYDFDRSRVDGWYESLRRTRDNWRRDSGYSRRHRRRSGQPRRSDNQSSGRTSLRSSFDGNGSRSSKPSSSNSSKRSATKSRGNSGSPKPNGTKTLKFYLDLTDHIEAAPSIGPKTAERFEKIGIVTIADFLRQTAESMSGKINYKRISAEVIRQWQNQTRLVCRIPNLRGHDAQLLVACGITDAEELATMNPEKVYGIVGPFSETKEGLKIIRSGKKPDLAEVKDWIDWATNHRNLQAA